jgi:hypothetical protein
MGRCDGVATTNPIEHRFRTVQLEECERVGSAKTPAELKSNPVVDECASLAQNIEVIL